MTVGSFVEVGGAGEAEVEGVEEVVGKIKGEESVSIVNVDDGESFNVITKSVTPFCGEEVIDDSQVWVLSRFVWGGVDLD